MAVLISIIIPVKNGEPWIRQSLESIMRQDRYAETEIIILDSGSTDGTLNILNEFAVTVIPVLPGEFNHGETRNIGARHAQGKYVVMTVQDARAADNRWLDKLLAGFINEDVAAVCGSQVVPHEKDKNPVDWYRPVSKPRLKVLSFKNGDFEKLTPEEQSASCRWDDVNAMYRRDILLGHPFDKVSYGEDILWSKKAFLNGYTLVYNPAAIVYHYHHENEIFLLQRFIISWYFRNKYFGVLPAMAKVSLRKKLGILRIIFSQPGFSFAEKIYWWKYNQTRWAARKKAYLLFTAAAKNGIEKMEVLYKMYSSKIPQHQKELVN